MSGLFQEFAELHPAKKQIRSKKEEAGEVTD
jgi:hypothetical protein